MRGLCELPAPCDAVVKPLSQTWCVSVVWQQPSFGFYTPLHAHTHTLPRQSCKTVIPAAEEVY